MSGAHMRPRYDNHAALRDATSAVFAAALVATLQEPNAKKKASDLLHASSSALRTADVTDEEGRVLRRLASVVGDAEASPARIRRGVMATYRTLAKGSQS